MTFVRSLQTKGVFACCCNIADSSVFCEMVATNGKQEGTSNLLDADTGTRYLIKVPLGVNLFWNYTMEKVDAPI